MPSEQKARLEDVVNYALDPKYTEEDIATIRSHFNGLQGKKLVKVLRKCFLPTIADPEMPIEHLKSDIFTFGLDFKSMSVDEVKSIVMGRQETMNLICGGFFELLNIANIKEETVTERLARQRRDSTK